MVAAGGDRTRRLGKLPIAHGTDNGDVVFQHRDVKTVGMLGDVPLQHLEQRARVGGGTDSRHRRRRRHGGNRRARLAASFQGKKKISDRIRGPDQIDRQANAERSFEAKNQFGPPQAVDAEVSLEPAGEHGLAGSAVLGMKLARELADDGEQLDRRRRPWKMLSDYRSASC